MTAHMPPPAPQDAHPAIPARMRIARAAGRLRLVHAEVLFVPGMKVDEIFLLRSGTLLVFGPSGERLERWVTAPSVLGLDALLAGAVWDRLGVAQGGAVLDCLPAARVTQRLTELPDSHHSLLRALNPKS